MLDEYRIESTSVGQYLDAVYNEDIKIDQAVQRDFCWSYEMMNALIYSALSRKIYIPNFILAEERKKNGTKQTYVVDAGQRTETLYRFKYEGYKITKNLRNYLIPYNKKMVDENGNYIRDEYGNIESEMEMFDMRNKTYNDLPDELKSKFNGCPLTTAIYQDCTTEETCELVLLYNNHISMNASQKSLTYVGKFAEEIKKIKDTNRFLKDCGALTENEKKNGFWERIISESVMAVKHFENWKSAPKEMCDYLNNNSSIEEYKEIENYFNRLIPYTDKIENKEVSKLFTSKNMFIWMMLFDKFDKLHISDDKFGEFLTAFVSGLCEKKIDDENWADIDADRHTKNRVLIIKKVDYLEKLMMDFLHIDENTFGKELDYVQFVKENVEGVVDEDFELFDIMANDISSVLNENSWILSEDNLASYLAIIGYSIRKDEYDSLCEWLPIYERNNTFNPNQQESFLRMKNSFEQYLKKERVN